MTAPKPGDEVRVVIQGTVNTDWTQLEQLIASAGGTIQTLEIIPPALKVGDTVDPFDSRIANGTVIEVLATGYLLFKYTGYAYVGLDGVTYRPGDINGPTAVKFLP